MENIILENIGARIYVAETGSYRLLYANSALENADSAPANADSATVNADSAFAYNNGGDPAGRACWKALFPDGDGPCDFCPMERLSADPGSAAQWEAQDPRTGRHYQYESTLVGLPGGRRALLTYSFDITALKDRLAKVEQVKDDYMSRMSHEIFTPLNAITGMSAIAGSTDDAAKLKDYLYRINDASKQLLEIINNLFEISRLEADMLETVCEKVRLDRLIIDACADITAQVCAKDQEFHIAVCNGVPCEFKSDRKRLFQIIQQLLLNAVKFTPRGGSIGLRVSSDAAEGQRTGLVFAVSDNGIGINDEEKTRLFDAFEQADGSKKRAFGGVGLGLPIAKRLARLLGGDITAQSEPKSGSTFIFGITVGTDGCDPGGAFAPDAGAFDVLKSGGGKVYIELGCCAGGNGAGGNGAGGGADAGGGNTGGNGAGGGADAGGDNTGGASAPDSLANSGRAAPDLPVNSGRVASGLLRNGERCANAEGVYDGFLPVFDAAEALKNLKNIKKLYLAMLISLKNNPPFGEMREALSKNDFPAIAAAAQNLAGLAQKLCMAEMLSVLTQLETMAKRNLTKPELSGMFESAAARVYEKLDGLIDILNMEAKK